MCGKRSARIIPGPHRSEDRSQGAVSRPPAERLCAGPQVAESEALLDALWAHATQPRFAMCHEWKVGDLLMWNNLSVLHRRDPFDPKTRRVMHRSQIKGNERIA